MSKNERNGNRKPREQIFRARSPELGYYIIVTDTKETEQNYINGLRDSIPSELQRRLVIKVAKTKSNNEILFGKEIFVLAIKYPIPIKGIPYITKLNSHE